mmetsp:Transcript_35675/g.72716  ORF Transcript_35675/g.72716 Transcript_35675/m.72716 type:complete len:885 (+) Transcript_35675:54-2708(+)
MALNREVVDADDPLSLLLLSAPTSTRKQKIKIDSSQHTQEIPSTVCSGASGGENDDEKAYSLMVRPSDPVVPAESWLSILHHDPVMIKGERATLDNISCGLISYSGVLIVGRVLCTNYQLMFLPTSDNLALTDEEMVECNLHLPISYYKVPLSSIDRVDRSQRSGGDAFVLTLSCKDCRSLRFQFTASEEAENAVSVIMHFVFSSSLHHLFSFEHKLPPGLDTGWNLYDPEEEFKRQGVLLDWSRRRKSGGELPATVSSASPWRLSDCNKGFQLCSTYPEVLCVPRDMDDASIAAVACFRSEGRLPTLTWGYARSAGSIWRSSQPKVGVQGKQCPEDEALLAMAAAAGARQHNGAPLIHIVDCRPMTSARANALTGHGTENSANYTAARVTFCNMENIHSIREAYQRVERLALSLATSRLDASWGQLVEESKWLYHQRLLLAASHQVARLVSEREEPVLVHCSHGWDRTSQVSALAQLFLDPFYRTFDGFPVLVEKEFCAMGHPFQLRLAHGESPETRDGNQMSPIFLQFLDAVWQLCRTFPTHFEFNPRFLLCIAENLASCRFGTFLVSCERDRQEASLRTKTVSIWSYLRLNRSSFESLAYQRKPAGIRMVTDPKEGAFLPPVSVLLRSVVLWSDWFLRWSPNQSFTHHPFVSTGAQRHGTLGGALYDENDTDKSGCAPGDLHLSEASLKTADWEGLLSSAAEDTEKWRIKALKDTMKMMQAASERREGGGADPDGGEGCEVPSQDAFTDLESANSEVYRLNALVKKMDVELHRLQDELSMLKHKDGHNESPVATVGDGDGTGAGTDVGTGGGVETGVGAGVGAGAGAGVGDGTGVGTGDGVETRVGAGVGAGAGTGVGDGTGAGTGDACGSPSDLCQVTGE